MSDKDRKVSGSVDVQQDCDSRVAYELMRMIAVAEKTSAERERDPRGYYLKLYFQCRLATGGRAGLAHILKTE